MKKDVVKKLRKVAEQLPVWMVERKESTSGQALIKAGVKKDVQGDSILSYGIYHGSGLYPINHLAKLKEAYRQGGSRAVEQYAARALKKHAEIQKKKREQAAAETPPPPTLAPRRKREGDIIGIVPSVPEPLDLPKTRRHLPTTPKDIIIV